MNELWSRSLAKIYDGKLEDFKRLAEDLLSAIRENDSETLNYAIFLDGPGRVAVIIAQYASSAGWLAYRKSARSPPSSSTVTRRRRRARRSTVWARGPTQRSWRSSGAGPEIPQSNTQSRGDKPCDISKGGARRRRNRTALD
jgi:hypothetical protein